MDWFAWDVCFILLVSNASMLPFVLARGNIGKYKLNKYLLVSILSIVIDLPTDLSHFIVADLK